MRAAWRNGDFLELSDGGEPSDVSTQDKCKLPANYAMKNCGAHMEKKLIDPWYGRWRGTSGGKVANQYIDVKQLYHDAKVAGILCIGGPCKYDCIKMIVILQTNGYLSILCLTFVPTLAAGSVSYMIHFGPQGSCNVP